MRKTIAGILTAALMLSISATSAFAAGPGEEPGRGAAQSSCQGRYYVDEDKDGICDYADEDCPHGDRARDGSCGNCGNQEGSRNGRGRGYGCGGRRSRS